MAQVIAERIASQTARPDALELGTIQADMSLKLDRFAVPIPKGDYLVAEWLVRLSLPAFSITGTQTGLKDSLNGDVTGQATFSFQPATVDQVKLEFKPDLKPGDRVLVAWALDGTEPIILSKVVSS
ncbi:MAG: hypothetical protein AB7U63_18750 [Porticoccaceae bacterium]